MPVSFEQVVDHLRREEPNYQQAAHLGSEAVPHLMRLIQEGDPNLGSKATYLAAYINAEQSAEAVELAAISREPLLRIAAASSLRRLTHLPEPLAARLLDDEDVGVRKWTLRTLNEKPIPTLKTKVQNIAQNDPEIALRQLARHIVQDMP